MSLPDYTISSAVVNVNVETTSKILFLPAASTVIGRSFTIHDYNGFCGFPNFIYLSTVGIDRLDNQNFFVTLGQPYQAVQVFAQNLSNYAVLQNSTNNSNWFNTGP